MKRAYEAYGKGVVIADKLMSYQRGTGATAVTALVCLHPRHTSKPVCWCFFLRDLS